MFNRLINFINLSIVVFNVIVLIALLSWAFVGVWKLFQIGEVIYWKVFISLIAVLLFNLILVYCVIGLYRRNVKLTDLFEESEYAQSYTDSQIVFKEGDIETIMYLVVKGKVELVSSGKVYEQVQPGGFFGEMAIIDDLPRTATARCIGPCSLIAIDEKRFYTLSRELPFFVKEVMRAMSRRIRRPD